MAAPSLNSTVIARMAQAVYGFKLGNATMNEAIAAATVANGGINGLMNALYSRDFGSTPTATVATAVVQNLGVPPAAVADATAYITGVLNATAPANRGAALVDVAQLWSSLTGNAVVGAAATQFNTDIARAVTWSQTFGTADVDLRGGIFAIDSSAAGVMRITGNVASRIDITRQTDQVTGLDLNRNGVIEFNGRENVNPTTADDGKNFTVVDAYARNANNINDTTKNYTAPINFDGTGFAGDGTKTDGNIFLGGLNADTALGGIGNDFFAGGGSRAFNNLADGTSGGTQAGGDRLTGGRNADFAFAEISLLSPTDGNNTVFDGGTTADDTVAGGGTRGLGTQDNDTLLLEASDDDEPVTVNLGAGGFLGAFEVFGSASGGAAGMHLVSVESVNASGNLYGFLNAFDTVIGARAYDGYNDAHKVGAENYGRGSTAQLVVNGSADNNLVIGGYDNDAIAGNDGNDLLMGGDLRFLITNKNNPNLLDSKGGLDLTANAQGLVNDGKDNLAGGAGNDNIVFESDNGTISGDGDTATTSGRSTGGTDTKPYSGPRFQSQGDTLWVTDFSTGRLAGAVLAGEATASGDAMAKLTTDSTYRVDLGTGNAFKNYGGTATASQDTTNYAGTSRVTTGGIESVNATGLGAIDYKAAGSNSPETKFNNQQNYNGLQVAYDMRGNDVDNALLANGSADTLEGRGGDDVISGGAGSDRILMSFGDGIDWNARPVDANGDGLWDTTGGLVVASGVAWSQDFRTPAAPTAGTTTLVVDFGATVLNGVDTFVATFQVRIDGVDYGTTIPVATLAAAKSTAEVATIVNKAFQDTDKSVTVVATSPTTIEVRAVDKTPGDNVLPVVGTTAATGFFVTGQASGVGTYQAKGSILGLSGTNLDDDRLVIKSYDDRSINLGQDQTKNEISQAAQMVTNFGTSSTVAQGQASRLYIDSVREGDTVSVTINGTAYSYTVKAGEFAEQAATGLANAINRALDVNAASGQVGAAADALSFGDAFDDADPVLAGLQNDVNKAGVLITQTFVNNSAAFMNISASVTRGDGAGAFGTATLHEQSNTMFQMLGFDARNGALNSQDKEASPVILFQGRNTGTTTMSVLLTAKDAGGALNGLDSTPDVDDPAGGFINGDDLLIGGLGNDNITAKTGDDRILMSKGTDTVDGGGNSTRGDGSTQVYQDVLQGEEATFGAGSSFRVVLDGALGAAGAGKGTVTVIDSKGVATTDVTTFSGIELVRVLENNRTSALDVKALSDSVAVAVGNDSLAAEGLDILLTINPSTKYTIDANNNGALVASETTTATAVLGVENLTSGNANDRVTLDQTQATANNMIDLGAQQDNTVAGTLREGADRVTVNHADVTNNGVADATDIPLRPTLTLGVSAAGMSTLLATAGALGAAKFTDTYKGVEEVDIDAAATSDRYNDVLDVSASAGATINFGAGIAVGKSVGGGAAVVSTVAELEGNTLEAGGVVGTGATLGTEWLEVTGITKLEQVAGSAGNDRVIVGDVMQNNVLLADGVTAAFALANAPRRFQADITNTTANGLLAVATKRDDQGLYQFNLGGGTDVLDYDQETGNVFVSVDTGATDVDFVFVDDRVDRANGVERYAGGSGANWIDLVGATVATTIQYSREAKSNTPANEFAEPNGNDGITVDGLTRTAEVRNTADNAVYANFIDRTAANIVGASLWLNVAGSNNAETVIFTDNETADAHNLSLQAGANRVDYSPLSTTVNANIGSVNTAVLALEQVTTANGDTIRQNHATDPLVNRLTIVGSSRAGDQLNVTALVVGVPPVNPGARPNSSQVDPLFHVVNLSNGTVTESLFGQFGSTTTPSAMAFVTNVVGFENVSNAGDADVVHILGDNGRNSLTGGLAADFIRGSRGTAGDGSVDVGAGNRGDQLAGGLGADWFVYNSEADSPNEAGGFGDQDTTLFGGNLTNIINSRDTITDFVAGTDKVVFNVADNYDSLRAAGPVPADLGGGGGAGTLNSAVALAPVFAAGLTTMTIGKDAASAGTVNDFDNYRIDNTAATLTIADVILRVQATAASDVIDASAGLAATKLNAASADGLEVRVVYTDKSQSQAGGFDQIIHFTTGSDKIDLSFLKLPRYEIEKAATGVNYDTDNNNVVDALDANGNGVAEGPADQAVIRALGAAPVFAINGSAPNLFIDGAVYRPIATQSLVDGNGDPSTTVFIDVNGDGNYVPTDDMVVVLVGVAAPVSADFVFNQYGGIFGG